MHHLEMKTNFTMPSEYCSCAICKSDSRYPEKNCFPFITPRDGKGLLEENRDSIPADLDNVS